MVKKMKKYLKFIVCMALIMGLMAPSYAALSASDGSAFVTKAEFDSALADFNARLTTFEAGINSKIDSQVTSYLDRNGIWSGKSQIFEGSVYDLTGSVYSDSSTNFISRLYDTLLNFKGTAKVVAYSTPSFRADKSGLLFSCLVYSYIGGMDTNFPNMTHLGISSSYGRNEPIGVDSNFWFCQAVNVNGADKSSVLLQSSYFCDNTTRRVSYFQGPVTLLCFVNSGDTVTYDYNFFYTTHFDCYLTSLNRTPKNYQLYLRDVKIY